MTNPMSRARKVAEKALEEKFDTGFLPKESLIEVFEASLLAYAAEEVKGLVEALEHVDKFHADDECGLCGSKRVAKEALKRYKEKG